MSGDEANLTPKLLVSIIDRSQGKRLEDILREKHVHVHFMFSAMGTASSKMLKAFGLSGTEKTVCISMSPAVRIKPLMTAVVERLEFTAPGNGIAFVVPVSGVSAALSKAFSKEWEQRKERVEEFMDNELSKVREQSRYELIIALINQGFSEELMDAARDAGARGGTVINARRSGLEEAVKFFGVSLQAEKEVVAIVIPKAQKKELMSVIVKACGIKTEARGIVISLPIESCAGIDMENEYVK